MSELIVIIRPSFMKFCKDGCRAALFNHILYWIAKKAKDQSQEAIQSGEVTWYAKNEALTQQMANAWGSEKVRIETNDLVKMGLIGRGRNPKYGADRTKHFYFGKEQCEKLLGLCQEHKICLACLGLDNDIVHLIKTVKQICNPRNANHESVNCFVCPKHEHFWDSGLANHESVEAITKISTKNKTTKRTERKNGATQQKPNTVEEQDSSRSFVQPSLSSSQNFSSEEETKPKVTLNEDEQRIFDFAKPTFFPAMDPEIDEKLKEGCAELAKHIKTQKQFDSLVALVQTKFDGVIYLKNLVNALNEWLQTRPAASPAKPRRTDDPLEKYRAAKERAEQSRLREESQKAMVISSYDDDSYEDDSFYPAKVTEGEMLEKIAYFSAHYGDDANIETNQRKAMELRNELGVSLERFYDNLFHAQTRADHRGSTMSVFFEQLEQIILEKRAEQVG